MSDADRIKAVAAREKNRQARYAVTEFENLPLPEKRRRILLEQKGACVCGTAEWKGKPIVLEFHHRRLDKRERREDVEMLCPNCHSQTFDYRNKAPKSVP